MQIAAGWFTEIEIILHSMLNAEIAWSKKIICWLGVNNQV